MLFFSIITPTHQRPNELNRAIRSVLDQNYPNFEIIIINDSPNDTSYKDIEKDIKDHHIIYVKNKNNEGVNFSRNRALDMVSIKSNWIIFLDDDDYLAPNTLKTFSNLIQKHTNERWFICNRATNEGKSLTHISKNNARLNYAWNFLVTKRFKGDATHCINKNILKNIYFPKTIKQGDEWLFFYELSLRSPFFYYDFNATKTFGYKKEGLNFRPRTTHEQLQTLKLLYKEGKERKILLNLSFITYLLVRFVRSFVKK